MEYKDYYKTLGLDKNATEQQIKSAYRKLAMKYHPDKTKGDKAAEEKFKEINEAYEVLSDPEKKKKYDHFGDEWKYYQQSGQQGGFDWSRFTGGNQGNFSYEFRGDPFGSSGFSDFFDMLFGGGGFGGQSFGGQRKSRTSRFKPQDVTAEISISLEEAYKGTTRLFDYAGQKIKLNIKPGIKDGQILKIPGKGSAQGDLLISVHVDNHPKYERKNNDLYANLKIDLYTALLGGKVKVDTFKGAVNLNIPKSSQNGKTLRLQKMGMPVYGKTGEFGDLYVTLLVKLPENLSEKEIKLFKELQSIRK
jgi:curved DNA-binding protein